MWPEVELFQKSMCSWPSFFLLSKSYFEGGLGWVPCEQDAWGLSLATTIFDNIMFHQICTFNVSLTKTSKKTRFYTFQAENGGWNNSLQILYGFWIWDWMQEDVDFLTESFAINQAIRKGYVPQTKHVLGYVFVSFAYASKDFDRIELEITFFYQFLARQKMYPT